MIPTPTITEDGIISPTTKEVLDGWWNVFTSAFGADLTKDLRTPQGQLTTSFAATVRNRDDLLIQLLNQFDPQYSSGIWQDAIAELYFLTRQDATPSKVTLTFYGLSGSIIPKGFKVQDESGRIWATNTQVTIGTNGSISVVADCATLGAIYASANTITTIVQNLVGVDRVTNLSAAVVGKERENREDFEIRRQESVSANAKNTDSAVRGTISNLPNVVDCWVKSNHESTDVVVGSTDYPLPLHTILVSVVGGEDYDIAWQILVKAGNGCGFAGNTEITVTDIDAFAIEPPQYAVKFLRPANKTVKFRVKFDDPSKVSFQNSLDIKSAILQALSTGRTRARIAQNLRAVQYVPAVNAVVDLDLLSIEVSLDGVAWTDKIQFGVDQFPVCSPDDIEVS